MQLRLISNSFISHHTLLISRCHSYHSSNISSQPFTMGVGGEEAEKIFSGREFHYHNSSRLVSETDSASMNSADA